MEIAGWITIAILVLVFISLAFTRIGPDLILLGGLTLLLTFQVISIEQALVGFANEGVITIAALFVVVAGLRETGAIDLIAKVFLGQAKSLTSALVRVMFPAAVMSGFINNTPIVALMMPAVNEWARQIRISPSKLMIPLSYATIFGGVCTLIGTSTNLVVNGLVRSQANLPGFGMFDIAWVGLPCAAVGLLYLLTVGQRLLPDRRSATAEWSDPREYTVEMVVEPGSPLIGQTIEQAQLRHLPGLYLVEIDREGDIIPAVAPSERLHADDRLIFVGMVDSVVHLQKMRGLRPATNQVFRLDSPRAQRCLIEAVVSNTCPLAGKTIREGKFRTLYNAAVIAVARNGERLRQKIGDIRLQAGDTLLLEAHPSFLDQQRNSRDFFLVSRVQNSTPPRHERAGIALAIILGLVIVANIGWLSLPNTAMLAAGLMILTRCCSGSEARQSVDWQVLLVIAASFGIGQAMHVSGAAQAIALPLINLASGYPWLALAVVYLVTTVFTEMMTNNAAAVLVFPIALAAATTLNVSFLPFAIAIMVAASCSFATPIGYQTNLMVYGPGGYRFGDYFRIGAPLNLLIAVVAIALIPLIWAF